MVKECKFLSKKGLAFLIEEKDISSKLSDLIAMFKNKDILKKIINDQSQYSDKNVYKNINQILRKLLTKKINVVKKTSFILWV